MFDIPKPIIDFLIASGATPIDFILFMLIGVGLLIRHKDLSVIKSDARTLRDKYELLNTGFSNHAWIIFLKTGIKTIRKHRTGDIELVNPLNEMEE